MIKATKSRVKILLEHTLNEIDRVNREILRISELGIDHKYEYIVSLGPTRRSPEGEMSVYCLKLGYKEKSDIECAVNAHIKQMY